MEEIVETVEEMKQLLIRLKTSPDEAQLLHNLLSGANSLKDVLLQNTYSTDLPLLQHVLVGGEGSESTGTLLSLCKDFAKDKSLGPFLEAISRTFILLLKEKPQSFAHKSMEFKNFCTALYFGNPAARVKVAALQLLDEILKAYHSLPESAERLFNVEDLARRFHLEMARTGRSSSSPTVAAHLIELMGSLCRLYPAQLGSMADTLLPSFLQELRTRMRSSTEKLDLTLVEGYVKGLDSLLSVHGLAEGDVESLESLYDILKKLCRLPPSAAAAASSGGSISRRGAMRAGLELFARHASLFAGLLVTDVPYWYAELRPWCDAANRDDHRAGMRAMSALLTALGQGFETLTSGVDSGTVPPPPGLTYLLAKLKALLTAGGGGSGGSSLKDVSLAVQGYGQLARPLYQLLPPAEYLQLVQEVLAFMEQLHLESAADLQRRWSLELAASHLAACALLARPLISGPGLPEHLLFSLEALAVSLVRKFPSLPTGQYQSMAVAALRQLLTLSADHQTPGEPTAVVVGILETVVGQAVLETCSHPTELDTDVRAINQQQLDVAVVTYRNYLPLWRGLLRSDNNKLVNHVYDSFVVQLVSIIDRLDLSVRVVVGPDDEELKEALNGGGISFSSFNISLTQTGEGGDKKFVLRSLQDSTEEVGSKRAAVVKDYTILVNLVALAAVVIPAEPSATQLAPKLPQLWDRLSCWTYRHPDVSSFYRLAAILLERTNMQEDQGDGCRAAVLSYLEELLDRVHSFHQGELCLSALSLVTAIPTGLVPLLGGRLPPVLPHLWQLGLIVPRLAQAGLKAVHSWLDCLSADEGDDQLLDQLLTATLPHLRTFLAYRPQSDVEEEDRGGEWKKARGRPIRVVVTERLRANMAAVRSLEEDNCNLAMELVARVATRHKALVLARDPAETAQTATYWDHRKHLRLDLPLPDANVPLYIDHLLPTLMGMVKAGADRRMRTAAAELLHAAVTVMVGQTAAHTEEMEAKRPMTELFRRILPAIFDLATDSDSVIQELFRPLFSQLIHWFTKASKYESPEAVCLLNCLFDVVCDGKRDSGQKRQAALYIGEFADWVIRQAGSKRGHFVARTHSIRSVLNRLYFLWRHPDVSKRHGACLSFEHLYRLLREEEGLVSEHLLEILAAAMACLRLSHMELAVLNRESVELARASLDHVKRMLFHYLSLGMFTAADTRASRRVPPEIRGEGAVHVLEWLLGQAHGDATEARHYAMELFYQLERKLMGVHGSCTLARDMLMARYGSLAAYMREVEAKSALRDVSLPMPEGKAAMAYLGGLQAVFENYHWLLDMKMCSIEELLACSHQVETWFNQLIKQGTKAANLVIKKLSAREELQLTNQICVTLLRSLTFLTSVLNQREEMAEVEKPFMVSSQKELCEIIMLVVLEPTSGLGLQTRTLEDRNALTESMVQLMKSLRAAWPDFYSKLQLYLKRAYWDNDLFGVPSIVSRIISMTIDNDPIHGYKMLAANGLLTKEMTDSLDAGALLQQVVHVLPEKAAALARLPPDRVDQLIAMVDLLVTLASPQAVTDFITKLSAADGGSRARSEWFLRHCGSSFSQQLLAGAGKILAAALSHDNLSPFIRILSILVRLLGGTTLATREASSLPLANFVLQHWDSWAGSLESRTDILRTIFIIQTLAQGGFVSHNASVHAAVSGWFCRLLRHPTTDLKVKAKAFRLLGLVVVSGNVKNTKDAAEELRSALLTFSTLHLPVHSRELPEDSLEQNLYKNLFRHILAVFEQSAAVIGTSASGVNVLLYFLISVAARETEHVLEQDFQNSLVRAMAATSIVDSQLTLLAVPWAIYADSSGTFSPSVRLACLGRFLLPMATAAGPAVIIRFFTQHMSDLLVALGIEMRAGSEAARSAALTQRLGAIQLFGLLYGRLDLGALHAPGAPLVGLASNILRQKDLFMGKGDGKELTLFLLKVLEEGRAEHEPEGASESLREMYRAIHCASLNTVAAIISCTQTTEKVFHAFVFKEKREKPIWSRIIDIEKQLDFPLQIDKDIGRRRHWVASLKSHFDSSGNGSKESISTYISQSSPSHSSHYLADSSLSQDLSRYDFTAASVTPEIRTVSTVDSEEAAVSNGASYVELEDDALGSHPNMAQLVAVVRLMASKAMYHVPSDSSPDIELPGYMKTLQALLADSSQPRNVKLFLLKLIYNASDVFQPFATHFYRPVLEAVSNGTMSLDGSLNYLILDLMIMLLNWSDKTGTRPDGSSGEKVALARALALLMKNVWHTDARIFKTNLELVRTLIALWKNCFDITCIDYAIVEELLSANGRAENLGALRLLSIMLENGVKDEARLKDPGFFRRTLRLAQTGGLQTVGSAAAHCVGLLLAAAEPELAASMRRILDPTLAEMAVASAAEERTRFIVVLHGVQRAYPAILADFSSQFVYSLRARTGDELGLCLEMLVAAAPRLVQESSNIRAELKMMGLDMLMSRPDPANQKLSLDVLKACIPGLPMELKQEYLGIVETFIISRHTDLRRGAFAILKACLDEGIDIESELGKQCVKGLMNGLGDSSESIRRWLWDYFTSLGSIPKGSFDRMKFIMKNLHFAETEAVLLTNMPSFILVLAKQSPNFMKLLFTEPLDVCQFVEYTVDTSWRQQHAVGTWQPLYAETLASQSQGMVATSVPSSQLSSGSSGLIRATQRTLAFSQTQSAAQNGIKPIESVPESLSVNSAGISRQIKVGSLVAGRRFTREWQTPESQKAYFSKAAEREKIRKRLLDVDRKESKKKDVELLRKYRKGDLPDIQIPCSDIIKPLMKLTQLSSEFARLVLRDLIAGILQVNETLLSSEDDLSQLSDIFNEVFCRSSANSVDFIISLLEVCLNVDFDLSLNTQAMAQLCLKPELNHLGVLIVEEEIITAREKAGNARIKKKKLTKVDEGRVEAWIRLADLFRTAGEKENMTGIFMQQIKEMNNHPQTPEALNMEANQDWAGALRVFKSLVENADLADSHLDQEVSLWHKGYYDAHIKLAKWDSLSTAVNKELEDNNMAAWESAHSGILIESLLTSGMHLSLEKLEFDRVVHEFINQALKDDAKKMVLVDDHPLEMAVLFALKQRYVDAAMFANHGLETIRKSVFLNSSLIERNCEDKLLEMQALSEISKFLSSGAKCAKDLVALSTDWLRLRPCHQDSLVAWDKILCARNTYLMREQESPMEIDVGTSSNGGHGLSLSLARCFVSLAEASVSQANVYFTFYCLKRIGHLMDDSPELMADRESIKTKVAILNYATREDLTAVDSFCAVFRSWVKLGMPEEAKNFLQLNLLHKDVAVCLSSIVEQNSHITPSQIRRQLKAEADQKVFGQLFKQTKDTHEAFRRILTDEVIQSFQKLCQHNWDNNHQKQGSILLEAATFIHTLLQSGSENVSKEALIDYHLGAMRAGSAAARQLFPRLLLTLECDDEPQVGKHFAEQQEAVPSWMFLAWRSQLISSLHNENLNRFTFPLTVRLAVDYPNALVYSVEICAENVGEGVAADYAAKLRRQLSVSPVHRQLLKSLALLTFPHIGLKDLVECHDNWSKWYPDTWQQKFAEECDRFINTFLSIGENQQQGRLHQKFAKEYGAKIRFKDIAAMRSILASQTAFEKKQQANQIKDFSPFLSSFQGEDHEDRIEIPGQYCGLGRPDPQQHAYISRFVPTLTIFSSIRKPMLIQMIGSNGRTYPFIVKAGEDLRQDERIEQLFDICNKQLAAGGSHSLVRALMQTYTVVPLTKRLGLIEFVANTLPLNDFIKLVAQSSSQMNNAMTSYISGMQALVKEHHAKGAVTGAMAFALAPLVPDEAVIKNYEKAVEQVERFNLRHALVSISAGAEGFYYLRKGFISSYAVISAVQWLLGIGDRHTSNYLVNKRTGQVVTIDFGYAFGVATSHLLVPELVPLRLTPQIVGLMEPLATHGLFRELLVRVLSALRGQPDIILAAMNAFIQEPTLDWLAFASKEAVYQRKDVEAWRRKFPEERVAIVKQKLEGANPTAVTVKELRSGIGAARGGGGPTLRRLIAAVEGQRLGAPGHRKAALWPAEEGLTASQQADCLIHQSTDKSLLGRMWSGWAPFC